MPAQQPHLAKLTRPVFDYFAGQLFDRAPETVHRQPLQLSFLPRIAASAARDLTGADDVMRGFKSPYLRNYVVARINPVRFHRTKKNATEPPMAIGEALTRMAAAARKFNLSSVSPGDLALVAAVASEPE